jgi:hypothetical protein
VECDLTSFRKRRAHLSGKKSAFRQVEESIMCQAELAEVFRARKWYNIRRFMGEKTQENLTMGYSAAYPTGAERTEE